MANDILRKTDLHSWIKDCKIKDIEHETIVERELIESLFDFYKLYSVIPEIEKITFSLTSQSVILELNTAENLQIVECTNYQGQPINEYLKRIALELAYTICEYGNKPIELGTNYTITVGVNNLPTTFTYQINEFIFKFCISSNGEHSSSAIVEYFSMSKITNNKLVKFADNQDSALDLIKKIYKSNYPFIVVSNKHNAKNLLNATLGHIDKDIQHNDLICYYESAPLLNKHNGINYYSFNSHDKAERIVDFINLFDVKKLILDKYNARRVDEILTNTDNVTLISSLDVKSTQTSDIITFLQTELLSSKSRINLQNLHLIISEVRTNNEFTITNIVEVVEFSYESNKKLLFKTVFEI